VLIADVCVVSVSCKTLAGN